MERIKNQIINEICYTELVYGRIRKKLKISKNNDEIEKLILEIINKTPSSLFEKIGKNYYINNPKWGVRITINSNTNRIITVDKIEIE